MQRILIILLLCASQNLSAQSFEGLTDAIEQGGYGSLKAVLISPHGEIIYEENFHGTQANDLHMMHAVTKSVGSALIGIAHRQGKIRLDQRMNEFFSQFYPLGSGVYAGKENITVKAVLQQRHGVEWDEWTLDFRDP